MSHISPDIFQVDLWDIFVYIFNCIPFTSSNYTGRVESFTAHWHHKLLDIPRVIDIQKVTFWKK